MEKHIKGQPMKMTRQEAYDYGYAEGYREGHKNGYSKGEDDGHDQGLLDAVEIQEIQDQYD